VADAEELLTELEDALALLLLAMLNLPCGAEDAEAELADAEVAVAELAEEPEAEAVPVDPINPV
jgi:hypothetical protein